MNTNSSAAAFQHREPTWSSAEKSVARRAFDRALQQEFDAVIAEARRRATAIHSISDVWELESYLTNSRNQIDRQFNYRYSVLIEVFGRLLHEGKLNYEDLQGLDQDKLAEIRRVASFLALPIP